MAELSFRPAITDFYLVTQSQAEIACIQHFKTDRLFRYMEALSFINMANGLAEKYFSKSQDLSILDHAARLYKALLIIAPVLQREPLSVRFDWQPGHVTSHFRVYTKGLIRRFHFGVRVIKREYQPDVLIANLEALGIHDRFFIDELLELYDRYDVSHGHTLQHRLADLLFDPIMLHGVKEGFELRHGTTLYRLEKQPFPGSVDLRYADGMVMQYCIRSCENSLGGRYLDIRLSDAFIAEVMQRFKDALASKMKPGGKVRFLFRICYDVVAVAMWAKDAGQQMHELSNWLANKVSSMAGTTPSVYDVPKRLYKRWCDKRDARLLLKIPNFFLHPERINQDAYMNYFNPFRGR